MANVVYVSKSQLGWTLRRLERTDKKESELPKQFEAFLTEFQLDHIFRINGLKDHFNKYKIVGLRPLDPDDLSMIYPDKHSRYHLSEDCLASRADYINGYIPEEFRNPVDAPQYRNWFKQVQEKVAKNGEINEASYRVLHLNRWGFAYQSKLQSNQNSGNTVLNSLTTRELIAEVYKIRRRIDKQIIEELEQGKSTTLSYITKYVKVKKKDTETEVFKSQVISNGDDPTTVISWLSEYRKNYQYPLAKKFVLLFLTIQFPDSSLDVDLARALGFVPCKMCCGKK